MHPRLLKAIEESLKVLTTCEEPYYSASKLKVDKELAIKILAEWIGTFSCQRYLEEVEEILLPQVYISDLLNSPKLNNDL